MPIAKSLTLLSLLSFLASCGNMSSSAARGEMGDISDDGSVGGISEVPNPSPEMASASGASLEQLQRGHSVYMLQCAQCHAYMKPEDFFDDEWQDTLPDMIGHTGLDSADEDAVLAYILGVKKLKT